MAQSIMQDEKKCFVTGSTEMLDFHHVFGGSRRKQADRYGCYVWLRHDVHMALHGGDSTLAYGLRRACQKRFEELYGHDKFMQIFGKNYL